MMQTVIDYYDFTVMLEKLRKDEIKICDDYMYWNPTDTNRIKIRDDRLAMINLIHTEARELKKKAEF